jgi:hypothetical protein
MDGSTGVSPRWAIGGLLFVSIAVLFGAVGFKSAPQVDDLYPRPLDSDHDTRVVILFHVAHDGRDLFNERSQPLTDAAWRTLRESQTASIKTEWLLQNALRDPQIAGLSLLKSQRHPIAWLQRNLMVGFLGESELMYVLMYCESEEATEVRQLVDAVARSYEDEVLLKEDMSRRLPEDTLARSLQVLNRQLEARRTDYNDMSKALGHASAETSTDLVLRRLDRIDAEMLNAENDLTAARLAANVDGAKVHEARVGELTRRREELEDRHRSQIEPSVDLISMRREIDLLQRMADDMTLRLERLRIDNQAPRRITRLYPSAIATPLGP